MATFLKNAEYQKTSIRPGMIQGEIRAAEQDSHRDQGYQNQYCNATHTHGG